MVVLARGDVVLATWPLASLAPLDLSVVDELARLQLAACRAGCTIRLRDACQQLAELLSLVGLAEIVVAETDWPNGG